MVQGLLVRLVGWVGVVRSSMVGLLWLRRGMVVLSCDELVAQTWRFNVSLGSSCATNESVLLISKACESCILGQQRVRHRTLGLLGLTAAEDMVVGEVAILALL